MRNPLESHPVWRQLLIVAIVLPVIVTLAILAFAWPTARLRPRDVPVGVVATAPASVQLVRALSAAQPGAFDLHLYADEHAAAAAIRQRDIYGAVVVGPARIEVLDASAAGPAVAGLLRTVGRKLDAAAAAAGGAPIEYTTTDVVPLSTHDPKGVVFSSALLPITICSIILASVVGLVVRFRPAWRQLVALGAVAAVAGLGVYLITQVWLGALPHQAVADWAALALMILALATSTAGLIALMGAGGLGLAAALFVFVGNPFSGVTSAPQLLPDAVERLGQWLPPGAGANLLRSTAYFDGHAAASHVAVLIAWVVAGAAAIVIGHRAPIRFAAARMASSDGAAPTPSACSGIPSARSRGS